MPAGNALPDLLRRTREVRGEEVFFRFSNGLTIKAEVLNKSGDMVGDAELHWKMAF